MTHRSNRSGFSLVEVMIVIGMLGIVGGLGLFFGIDSFRGFSFHSDKELLVTTLQHARAQSIANLCVGVSCVDGTAHGVKVLSDRFVLFQGTSYVTADHTLDVSVDANPGFVHAGIDEVVFAQLSGDASPSGNIMLTDQTGRTSMITVSSEGQITWTH